MLPSRLADAIRGAAVAALTERGLDASAVPGSVSLDRPRRPEHGDYTSNLALRVARRVGLAGREYAADIAARLAALPGVRDVQVAGPGFLNIRVADTAAVEIVRTVLEQGNGYGLGTSLAGVRLNLVIVPARPVDPPSAGAVSAGAVSADAVSAGAVSAGAVSAGALPVQDGRGVVVGEVLAELLRAAGADVTTAYRAGGGVTTAYRVGGGGRDRVEETIVGQRVTFTRHGRRVTPADRVGRPVALRDVVSALGADATRYVLARYPVDAPIELDLDRWTRNAGDNQVYQVRYAHARSASLVRVAAELGVVRSDEPDAGMSGRDPERDPERDLVRALGEYPLVLAGAAQSRQPHRLPRYLESLAAAYHRFQDECRVLPLAAELPTAVTSARLWLVSAAGIVLANGMRLLGVSAPERL